MLDAVVVVLLPPLHPWKGPKCALAGKGRRAKTPWPALGMEEARTARPGCSVFTARCESPAFGSRAWGGRIIVDKIKFRILINQLFGVSVQKHTKNITDKVYLFVIKLS